MLTEEQFQRFEKIIKNMPKEELDEIWAKTAGKVKAGPSVKVI